MAPSTSPNLTAIQLLGNASAINGLLPASAGGTLFPNQSTRPASEIALVTGIDNSLFPTGTYVGSSSSPSLGDPGVFVADVNLTTQAATLKGTGSTGFSGSSAVSAATAVGINSSSISIGGLGVVDPTTPTVAGSGRIFANAIGKAESTAYTGTGETPFNTSSAAVVDLGGAGITGTGLGIAGGGVKLISLNSSLQGKASAQGGTAVGQPTAAGSAPALTAPTPSTGVTSILNLNSRGINNQNAYFQTPISPFFAQFGGLPTPPPTITDFATGTGFGINGGTISAASDANGSSTAQNGTGDANAFAGVFSAGALLNGNNININAGGNIVLQSLVGQDSTAGFTPIETYSSTGEGAASAVSNLLSVGAGTAAVQTPGGTPIPAQTLYIYGNGDPNNGSVSARAVNNAATTAKSGNGDAVSYTGGLNGTGGNTLATNFSAGNTLTIGLFNVNVEAGLTTSNTNNDVTAQAFSNLSNTATTQTGSAIASNTGFDPAPTPKGSITSGIFGFDLATGNNNTINIQNGNAVGSATAVSNIQATSVMGTSAANGFNTVSGISNIDFTIAGVGGIGGTGALTSTVTAGVVAP